MDFSTVGSHDALAEELLLGEFLVLAKALLLVLLLITTLIITIMLVMFLIILLLSWIAALMCSYP